MRFDVDGMHLYWNKNTRKDSFVFFEVWDWKFGNYEVEEFCKIISAIYLDRSLTFVIEIQHVFIHLKPDHLQHGISRPLEVRNVNKIYSLTLKERLDNLYYPFTDRTANSYF